MKRIAALLLALLLLAAALPLQAFAADDNPVDHLELVQAGKHVYLENYGGFLTSSSGETYYYYYVSVPYDAQIRIHYKDGRAPVVANVGQSVDGYSVYYTSSQATEHWTVGGDNRLALTYRGFTVDMPVTLIENPVDHITLDAAPTRQYIWGDTVYGSMYSEDCYDLLSERLDLTGLSFTVHYKLTRVEPRYGLARRLFPSVSYSFLKGASLPANSYFAD